jgi:hypothetical protein
MSVVAVPYSVQAEDVDNYGGWYGMRPEPDVRCCVCGTSMALHYNGEVFVCRHHQWIVEGSKS